MKRNRQYFVSGISTEIGKTIISAILCEALKADYWKPVQSGDLDNSDSDKIRQYTLNKKTRIHPETYRLNTPASPHYAAKVDGVKIKLNQFKLPKTKKPLIVEGAGGLLVPLNKKDLIIDIPKRLDLPVILVSHNYLGSINHTLLSIEALERRNIKITGIIFNGKPNPATEKIIIQKSGLPVLGKIPMLKKITPKQIRKASCYLSKDFLK